LELSFGPGILIPCGSCYPKFVDFTIQSDDSIVEIGISPARAWMFPPEMLDVTKIKIWQPQFGLKKNMAPRVKCLKPMIVSRTLPSTMNGSLKSQDQTKIAI
jgi:hypothetical protein